MGGVDQKPAGTWGLKTTCPSAIGSDANTLFNATSYYGTTQWANATCTDVILGAQRYAINACLPRPTAVAPYPTASWKWTSCTSVESFDDQACTQPSATTTAQGTPPPDACNPNKQCCEFGQQYVDAICVGAKRSLRRSVHIN